MKHLAWAALAFGSAFCFTAHASADRTPALEPENDTADGNTDKDIEIASDGTIYLRAERSGSGPGRTYSITYRAVDASGNVGHGTAKVFVPHDAN